MLYWSMFWAPYVNALQSCLYPVQLSQLDNHACHLALKILVTLFLYIGTLILRINY